MKQVININFHGAIVPIETTAYDMLKGYIESLNKHFANEEGKEEIINDIESRIAELFQERIKKGATCITDDDVNAIIDSMGRVEDFEKEDGTAEGASQAHQQSSQSMHTSTAGPKRLYRDENNKVIGGVAAGLANYFNIDIAVARIIFVVCFFLGFGLLTYIIMWIAVPSSSTQQIGSVRRKLYRDTDNKLIAGVCSGIGNYFGISAWIPRVLFILPFISFLSRWGNWGGIWGPGDVFRFTFSPTSLIIYIILWIVIPEALTTSEKLEMKGEKVDLDSIKNSVMEEMKSAGKKAQSFGKEIAGTVNEKAGAVASDVHQFAKRNRSGAGDVIAVIAKIIAYFFIGVACLVLIGFLISLIVISVNLFPLKDYLLDGGWQSAAAWGTLLFFIAVPIIGILVWIIRRLTNSKANSRMLSVTFSSLWVIGWISVIYLVASVNKDFLSYSNLPEKDVTLTSPKVNKLIITDSEPFERASKRIRWSRFESFDEFLHEDTVTIQNLKFDFVKSPDDSFHVSVLRRSKGRTKDKANTLASLIQFNVRQTDSLLLIDKGIDINKHDKFRNQNVVLTVYVPVGKQIRVENDFYRRFYFNGFTNVDDYERTDYYDFDSRWQSGVDYVMHADGNLYTLNGKRADGYNDRKNSKVRIGPGGIDVQDGNSRVRIGPGGISVDEKNDEDNTDEGNNVNDNNYRYNKTDSVKPKPVDKTKDELQRENDSLRNRLKNKGNAGNTGTGQLNESVVTPLLIVMPGLD